MTRSLSHQQPAREAPVCPVCGMTDYQVQWQYKNRSYGVCRNCGLAFVSPFEELEVETERSIASSVTKSAYLKMMKQNAAERGVSALSVAQRRLDFYTRLLHRKPESILEIGAGDGAFSEAYSRLGVGYVGFDIDHGMVESAQALGRNLKVGSIDEAAALGEAFDVVFASQVFEHVLTPVPFLNEIRRLLSGNGLIHLDVPNHDGLSALIRRVRPSDGEYGFLQPPHHQLAYAAPSVRKLLEQTGYGPILIAAKGNLDPTWGQLTVTRRPLNRFGMRAAGLVGLGSLLVVVARSEKS